MPRQLSGFKPTGPLQLGNYLGAIRPMVDAQHAVDPVVLVVDLHALTVEHDPAAVRARTLEYAALLLAAGVDPDVSLLYVQSHVPEHSELHYLLEATTGYGEAQRMIQFKEKSANQERVRLSLLTYPVLMASDILLLTPQTLSVITMIFPAERRGAAFGLWGAVAGVATVAGPTLGGFIVSHWGWRWIFFVNVPIGIGALVMAAIVMPNLQLNRRHRLDFLGTALATAGLFAVTYGLIEGQPHDWGKVWGQVTIPMVIGARVVLLAVFLVQQYLQRDSEPLVPFAIFRDRNYATMNFVVAALGFGMLGLFLPLVIYLQSVLGLSALQAGLTVAPMSLVSMVVAPVTGRLADRIGGKFILMTGLTLFATGMAVVLASAHVGSSPLHLLPGLVVAGLGMGCTFAPMQTVAMRNVAPRMAGAASGVINTTRQLGAVIGSAAVGALLQNQLAIKLTAAAERNAAALPPQFRSQFVTGFAHASGRNLEVGAGQTGAKLPPGLPEQARQLIQDVATTTFHEGFVDAMRVSLVLPIAVIGAAALSCLFVRGRGRTAGDTAPREPAEQTADAMTA